MKAITFSIEEQLHSSIKSHVISGDSSLNSLLGGILARISCKDIRSRKGMADEAIACVDSLSRKLHLEGRKYTREEMNER